MKNILVIALAIIGILLLLGLTAAPGSLTFTNGGTVTVYRGENVFFRVCHEANGGGSSCQFISGSWDATNPWYIYVDDQLVTTIAGYRQQPSYSATFSPQHSFDITDTQHVTVPPTQPPNTQPPGTQPPNDDRLLPPMPPTTSPPANLFDVIITSIRNGINLILGLFGASI